VTPPCSVRVFSVALDIGTQLESVQAKRVGSMCLVVGLPTHPNETILLLINNRTLIGLLEDSIDAGARSATTYRYLLSRAWLCLVSSRRRVTTLLRTIIGTLDS
jgi:hypothetical protein